MIVQISEVFFSHLDEACSSALVFDICKFSPEITARWIKQSMPVVHYFDEHYRMNVDDETNRECGTWLCFVTITSTSRRRIQCAR
jgi:hypothetical protein